jgi:hypothetical protein
MNELFALALAKFPPSRIPALLEEMLRAKDELLQSDQEDAKVQYVEFLGAGEGVVSMLAATQYYDIVLVDQDLDDAGYSIYEWLSIVLRAYQSRQLPLLESEVKLRQDAHELLSTLFPKGNEIFRYSHLAEWSEVKTLLQRSELPDNAKKIEGLGAGYLFTRLQRCHEALGLLLGIQGPSSDESSVGLARFEEALSQLISLVVLRYGKELDHHRHMRELLVGPVKRHIEAYREEVRRRQARLAANAAKQEEPEPTSNEDSGV